MFKPNTVDSNNKIQVELDSLLSTHMQSRPYSDSRIDIAHLTALIDHLKRQKADSIDDIVSEHIFYAGHQLSMHLCMLINALLAHSFVSRDFCKNIIVPLLKSKHGNATQPDRHRGITLVPALSKLFEIILLQLFLKFLVSDDLQFGFIKRSSCSHALFAFTESIKYFTLGVIGVGMGSSRGQVQILNLSQTTLFPRRLLFYFTARCHAPLSPWSVQLFQWMHSRRPASVH